MPRTFSVTINGTAHTRTSQNRTYTHAIAVLQDRERGEALATGWTAEDQAQTEKEFRFYQDCADGTWWTKHGFVFRPETDTARVVQSRAVADAGLEEFVRQVQAEKLEHFRHAVATGAYDWQVHGWAGSEKLALSQVRTLTNRRSKYCGWYASAVAVAAGTSVELPTGQEVATCQ